MFFFFSFVVSLTLLYPNQFNLKNKWQTFRSHETAMTVLRYEELGTVDIDDYQIITTSVVMTPGQVTATVTVEAVDDDLIEIPETIIIFISEVSGNVLIDPDENSTLVTIQDNDSGKILFCFSLLISVEWPQKRMLTNMYPSKRQVERDCCFKCQLLH